MKEYEKSKQVLGDLVFYPVVLFFAVSFACMITGRVTPRWIEGVLFAFVNSFLMVRLIIMILESRHGADK